MVCIACMATAGLGALHAMDLSKDKMISGIWGGQPLNGREFQIACFNLL